MDFILLFIIAVFYIFCIIFPMPYIVKKRLSLAVERKNRFSAVPRFTTKEITNVLPEVLFSHPRRRMRKQDLAFASYIGDLLWWAIKGSNLGPTGYEPVALTN